MPIWNTITQILDWIGKPKDAVEAEWAKALDLLEQVYTSLDDSLKVLESAKPALTNDEIDMLEDRHGELYLEVVAIRTDVWEKKERYDCFSSPEEKTEFYTEVQKLLRQCQSYHSDVLTTSERARLNSIRPQPKDTDAFASSTQPTPGSNLNPSWIAVTPSAGPPADSETLNQRTGLSGNLDPGLPYLANIDHTPQSATEQELLSELPDDDHYYRLMVYGNRQKRVVVLDPNPHPINGDDLEDDAERSPDEFFEVGDMLMQSDPQNLEDDDITSSYQGLSLVTAIFSMLSLNPDSLRLGGMV